MRDILFFAMLSAFLVMGRNRPFILAMGYAWIDFFTPQRLASGFFTSIPSAMVLGAATLVVYLLPRTRIYPKSRTFIYLVLIWALWMTVTLSWAEMPDDAWNKWNWAFKVAAFSALLPFLFRDRIQLEALLLTILFAVFANTLTFGVKSIISGGGYGKDLALVADNTGLGEGSTLANISVAMVPIALYLNRYSLVLPAGLTRQFLSIGFAVVAIATTLGTFARTGLVDLAVFVAINWLGTKRKLRTIVGVACVAAFLSPLLMSTEWNDRMGSIANYSNDSSAMGRLGAWKWTLEYVAEHPFGGGFDVFRINDIAEPLEDGSIVERHGVAFHSMYFEVLGEQGFIGAAIFLALIANHFLTAVAIRARARLQEPWIPALAGAVTQSTAIYLVGGSFIGIAFQPYLYYMFASMALLSEFALKPSTDGTERRPARTVTVSPAAAR